MSWGLEQTQARGKKASWGLEQGQTSGEKAPWGIGAGSPREKGMRTGVGLPQENSMRTKAGFGRESFMEGRAGLTQESIMRAEVSFHQQSVMGGRVNLQQGNGTGQEPVHAGKAAQSPAQALGIEAAWTPNQLPEKEMIPKKETMLEPEKTAGRWIWYYGDFEIYHSLKLHARRDEFEHNFPPFWRLDDCRHNVRFRKEVTLKAPEMITVYARGVGNVEIDGKRRAFEKPVYLAGGKHTILVSVLNRDGLPCIYVEGKTIASDESWLVSCYGREWENAGSSEMYTSKTDEPQVFKFCYEEIEPVEKREMNGGILYDFGRETFAKLHVGVQGGDIDIFYGETQEEALDTENSYLRAHVHAQGGARPQQENSAPVQSYQQGEIATHPHLQEESGTLTQPQEEPYSQEIPARAFRFLYIRAASEEDYRLSVYHEYLPLQVRGSFRCSDERLDRIWDTAAYTFGLNSREFFLDGIKRDRWVWSGDAYQSYLINRYLFFDEDICRRTILALRGLDPVEKHINTIMDYSFYWLISIYDYYEMSGDREFVRRIYPRMRSLMEFCMSRLDADGFAAQVEDDWIFIDWADMDKTGAVCAEQLLLARSLEAIAECGQVLGEDCAGWRAAFAELREKIDRFFWDEEKGAFIDSFASGRRNVTRHANIFALLFGYANEAQREQIVKNVLQNDAVPQIRTPYFKLYELEALCRAGRQEEVTERIRAYWGAMLDAGATSFWEEYMPELPWDEQLGMYGDKYGKSLCHAWGASPVYLAGRYYLGVRPTSPGYKTFEVAPNPGGLDWFEGTVPVGAGQAAVRFRDGVLEVCTDADGGVLVWKNERYPLEKGEVKRLSCNQR